MTKAIQLKRADVVEDIRALAALTGESLTDVVAKAVRNQLAMEQVKANARLSKRRLESSRMLAELRCLAVIGPLLTDDDLYDAEGLPK